jgi:hypothetical protein
MGIFSSLFGGDKRNAKTNRAMSIMEQLETFEALGLILNEGIDRKEIVEMANAFHAENTAPYATLYVLLGCDSDISGLPFTNFCWDFDTEAIEDYGSYVHIVSNISRITKGELIFENIEDYVDLEEEKAWVSFICRGDKYKWNLAVDDDWVDGSLFDRMQELATYYNTKGKFTYYNTGGQDFVLGFHTPEELEKIRDTTKLEIVWLKAEGQIY